jgi:multimeric flavodoxin WrbA
MKVVAINGSARKDGNTAILLNLVLDELKAAGIGTELLQTLGQARARLPRLLQVLRKEEQALRRDQRLRERGHRGHGRRRRHFIGSPTYFANVSAETKALIDRAGLVSKANENMFARKVGAAVVAERRARRREHLLGHQPVLHRTEMIVPGASYWNVGFGREIGKVEGDEEGLKTMRSLGRNMAWLMGKLAA